MSKKSCQMYAWYILCLRSLVPFYIVSHYKNLQDFLSIQYSLLGCVENSHQIYSKFTQAKKVKALLLYIRIVRFSNFILYYHNVFPLLIDNNFAFSNAVWTMYHEKIGLGPVCLQCFKYKRYLLNCFTWKRYLIIK